jgi:hypothetical protein
MTKALNRSTEESKEQHVLECQTQNPRACLEEQTCCQISIQSSGIPTRLVKTLHLSRLPGPDESAVLVVEPMEELLCYHKLSKGSRLA